MNNTSRWHTLALQDTVVRVRPPRDSLQPQALFVLLHGWTGDETVMTPFAAAAPEDALVLSFRAPFPTRNIRGGYSWIDRQPTTTPFAFSEYQPAFAHLSKWLHEIGHHYPAIPWRNQHWIGFSQGASVVAAYALQYPQGIRSLALLAGFLPAGAEALIAQRPLVGKQAFVAHGVQDPIVAIRYGREVRDLLAQAGAEVTYCEDDVGHKVSARCQRGLQAFYQQVCAR